MQNILKVSLKLLKSVEQKHGMNIIYLRGFAASYLALILQFSCKRNRTSATASYWWALSPLNSKSINTVNAKPMWQLKCHHAFTPLFSFTPEKNVRKLSGEPFITYVFSDYHSETSCFHLPFSKEGSEIRHGPRWEMTSELFINAINMAGDSKMTFMASKAALCGKAHPFSLCFCVSAARKADPRVRGRATPATGEWEASPGGDGGVRAGTSADGFTAAAILQVKNPIFPFLPLRFGPPKKDASNKVWTISAAQHWTVYKMWSENFYRDFKYIQSQQKRSRSFPVIWIFFKKSSRHTSI